jgi:hypothetical protein
LVAICFILIIPRFANAESGKSGRLFLVTVNALSYNDISSMFDKLPAIRSLAQGGAIGLMNTNTAGRKVPDASYLTIGAGVKSLGSDFSGMSYNSNDTVSGTSVLELYKDFYGREAGKAEVINLSLNSLVRTNSEKNFGAIPGKLGSVLHQNKMTTAIYAEMVDIASLPQNYGPLILIDKFGVIDYGNVNVDTKSSYDFATPSTTLYDEYIRDGAKAGIVHFDFSQNTFLDRNASLYSDIAFQKTRLSTMYSVDELIGKLLSTINPAKDMIIFLSPMSSTQGIKSGETLTMVIAWGENIEPGTLITSGSTRRRGIITNSDIAPTILSFGRINPSDFIGRPIRSSHSNNSFNELQIIHDRTLLISQSRPNIIQSFIYCQVFILLTVLALIMLKHKSLIKFKDIFLSLLFAMSTIPFVLLAVPFFQFYLLSSIDPLVQWLSIGFLSAILVICLRPWARNPLVAFAIMAFFTLAIVLVDVMIGSPLAMYSTFSYDPIIGARFYGIGNEYLGVVLGAWIILLACLFELFPRHIKICRIIGLLSLIFVIVVMAAPSLGANVGGTIAGVLGLGCTYLLFLNGFLPWKRVVFIFVALGVVMSILVTVDMLRPLDSQTHLARLVSSALNDGVAGILNTFSRKIAMNLKLLAFTRWSWMLFTSLLVLFAFYFRPVGLLQTVMRHNPMLRLGFIGSVLAAVFAFIFNDSGVVAVGTLNIFPVMLLTSLMLRERLVESETNKMEVPQ